jgi:predicted Na+-dependent transporter
MEQLTQALTQTPLWVYVIFAYCLFVGYKGTQGGVVPFGKMLAIPIIFTVMSIESLYNHFTIDGMVILTYIIALIVGVGLGQLFASMVGLEVDQKKWLLKFPGSYSTLILILLIFSTKYYFGYELGSDPSLAHNSHFEYTMLSVSALITGIFMGRALYYFLRLKKGPSVELGES